MLAEDCGGGLCSRSDIRIGKAGALGDLVRSCAKSPGLSDGQAIPKRVSGCGEAAGFYPRPHHTYPFIK